MSDRPNFLDELRWRGLFNQCTDEAALAAHLASADFANGGRRAYIGFDPTADSLTIGNLVQIMVLAHFQRAGHTPIVLLGGATGQIGDPSGKSAERTLSDKSVIETRVAAQSRIFGSVLNFNREGDGAVPNAARMVNNNDWWKSMSYLDVLRDIGKHFSVNMMIQKDSVKERLHNRDQGISYTEFSYMILQAYDFLHLWEHTHVTLQMGASDQWGNIVGGVELIRRGLVAASQSALATAHSVRDRAESDSRLSPIRDESAHFAKIKDVDQLTPSDLSRLSAMLRDLDELLPEEYLGSSSGDPGDIEYFADGAFGLTTHLLTKADGGKFGKTEKGAVWLTAPDPSRNETAGTPGRTTPYALYQYLLNLADADCGKFLRIFTFLTQPEVLDIEARHAADPGQRLAQRTIAHSMVAMLHGEVEAEAAAAAARALFSGDIATLSEETLREVFADAPASTHPRARLDGDSATTGAAGGTHGGVDLIDLLVETSLATSKKQAREFLSTNAITINGQSAPADHRLRPAHLLHNSLIAIRRGKKNWHLTKWE